MLHNPLIFFLQNDIDQKTKLCLACTVNLSMIATSRLYFLFSKAHFQMYLCPRINWWECICIYLHGE